MDRQAREEYIVGSIHGKLSELALHHTNPNDPWALPSVLTLLPPARHSSVISGFPGPEIVTLQIVGILASACVCEGGISTTKRIMKCNRLSPVRWVLCLHLSFVGSKPISISNGCIVETYSLPNVLMQTVTNDNTPAPNIRMAQTDVVVTVGKSTHPISFVDVRMSF